MDTYKEFHGVILRRTWNLSLCGVPLCTSVFSVVKVLVRTCLAAATTAEVGQKGSMPDDHNKPDWFKYEITTTPVEKYLYSMLPERDEVLTAIENEAIKRDIPIVGPAVGRFLHQLALVSGAKTVFELGSAVGYSTIWWARAVGDGGRVIPDSARYRMIGNGVVAPVAEWIGRRIVALR